jgi:hypothetical protein
MHLIRTALLTLACAALAAPAAASAATVPATGANSAATVTRIVIYKGGGDKTPVGPAGPLGYNWTVSTTPDKITTTNEGTLVEDTSLVWSGGSPGGEWWYSTSQAVLHVFYWDQPGGAGKVEATNLATLLNNNNAWFHLGNGTYSPRCLAWTAPDGQAQYIQLTKEGGDWKGVPAADACTTAP